MILNKPLYEGRAVWNRSQKVRDPDTGKRVMRIRPEEEWVWTHAPELRIIPEALWKAERERRAARRLTFRGPSSRHATKVSPVRPSDLRRMRVTLHRAKQAPGRSVVRARRPC